MDHLAVMDEHRNQDALGMETRTRKQRLVKKSSVRSPGNHPEASWVFLPTVWRWASLLLRLELEAVSCKLALAICTCHLPPQGLNCVLLQLLIVDTSWKGFRVEGRKEAFWALGWPWGMGWLGGVFGMGTQAHPGLIMPACGKAHSNIVK